MKLKVSLRSSLELALCNISQYARFLRRGTVTPLPNPHARGPPLVSCSRLFIYYIRSDPPYFQAVSSTRNLMTRHAVVTRDTLNTENILKQGKAKLRFKIKLAG
jgi:hypothetical protein